MTLNHSSTSVLAHKLNAVKLFAVVVALLSLFGLSQLTTSSHYHAYFDDNDELVKNAKYFEQTYQVSDSLLILITNKQLLSNQSLALYQSLDEWLQAQSTIAIKRSFYSPTLHYGYSEISQHDEIWQDFNAEFPTIQSRIAHTKNQPNYHWLIGKSATVGVIELKINIDKSDANALLSEMTKLSAMLNQLIQTHNQAFADNQNAQISWHYTGPIALNHAYIDVVRAELIIFVPGVLLLFLIVLRTVLGQLSTSLVLVGAGLVSCLIGFGMTGLLSITGLINSQITAINAFTPVIIITLSIAANLHLVIAFQQSLRAPVNTKITEFNEPNNALLAALSSNKRPLIFSMLSTAFGFAMLLSSPSPPIQNIGITIGFAMLANLVICLIYLPNWLLKTAADKRENRCQMALSGALKKLAVMLDDQGTVVMLAIFLISAVAIAGLSQFNINDKPLDYFAKDHPFSQGTAVAERELAGVSVLNYQLTTAQSNLANPSDLAVLAAFKTWLASEHQASLITPLNRLLDNPALVDSLELSSRSGSKWQNQPYFSHWFTANLQQARLQILLPKLDSQTLLASEQSINRWFNQANAHQDSSLALGLTLDLNLDRVTSPDLTFATLVENNAKNMFFSLVFALFTISIIIGLVEKSVKIALIACLCNSLPIALVYGLWSLIGGDITLGSALVMGMIMGIIVDDSLHLIHKRRSAHSISALLSLAGPAIVTSSIMILLGLSVGLAANFKPISDLSILVLLSIVAALVADLLLLPLLLKKAGLLSIKVKGSEDKR